MSILGRVSDILKANINDLLERAEDPEKMIKQMVVEMEEAVNKATMALGMAIANEKTLQRQIEHKQRDAADFQEKAVQALKLGREDLAKQALERKNSLAKAAQTLEPAYAEAKASCANLREQLDKLKGKLEEARTRESTLIARSQAAKAKKEIAQSFSGVGDDAFSKFEKFEQKVEKIEAEADAFTQLAGEGSANLDDELAKLTAGSEVDDELAALKASMTKQLPQ